MTAYQPNVIGDISSYMQTIYEDALLVARDNNIMSQLATVFSDRKNEAETRKLSRFTGLTVNSFTDVDDLTSQQFTPSVVSTLTPAMAGGQYWLTDARLNSSPFEERSLAARDMGEALATKIETDLLGDISSFTGGTVGAGGSVIGWNNVFQMETIMRANKVPYPYFLVMHPYTWYPLGKAASVAGAQTNAAPNLLNAVNSMFFVKQVGGIYIFTSANVTSGTAAKVGMWGREALALDIRRAPRLEPQRDASKGGGGYELNLTTNYAHGVWDKVKGVQGTFDASTPS